MKDMSIIKLTVEDSKVSEILQALLNSNATVKDVEVTVARPDNMACITPCGYVVTNPYVASQPYVCGTWRNSTTCRI